MLNLDLFGGPPSIPPAVMDISQKVRRPRQPKKALVRQLEFDESQLDLPLFAFTNETTELDQVEEVEALAVVSPPEEVGVGESEERVSWTHEEITEAHYGLLYESLKILASRGNAKEKADVLRWVFEPDYLGQYKISGRLVHLFTDDFPFTFACCCRLVGADPAPIRDFILRHVPKVAWRSV